MKTGRVTVSDRASAGTYPDRSGPEIESVLREVFGAEVHFVPVIVPDEAPLISAALKQLADEHRCDLIFTTGGTGISSRDVTPEATRAILEKELPGFGEIMRVQSFARVKTAILSRAVAGTRGRSLIVNLPGKPTAVRECLEILAPAIREVIAHLRGEDPHTQPTR
jgi:molybdopterin adenylyltransferase